jgi:hypothetical protein
VVPRPGQVYKVLSVFFAFLAVVAAVAFVRMGWSRGSDFDVTGFLLLTANAGRITVLFLFLTFTGLALSYWYRAWRAGE